MSKHLFVTSVALNKALTYREKKIYFNLSLILVIAMST